MTPRYTPETYSQLATAIQKNQLGVSDRAGLVGTPGGSSDKLESRGCHESWQAGKKPRKTIGKWWFHGGFMVVEWWFNGGFMVV